MAVYLIHIPVRLYFEHYQGMDIAQIETIKYVTGASIVLSIISTYAFEEPMRKLLRK